LCRCASRNFALVLRLAWVRNGFSALGGAATIASKVLSSPLGTGATAGDGVIKGMAGTGRWAACTGSGWIISPSQCSTSWRRARLRIRAAPARPIISKEPPPNAQSNAGSVRASDDAGGACLSGAAGAAGATASANGADDAGADGAGDGASRCVRGSERCGAATGSVRAIVRAAGRGALRFTGAAAGTACASSACDAVIAASNRCSTEGVDWTTGWEGAKTGAGEAAGGVCATGGSTITGCAGGMTVCANSVGELIARTAAIAALAGRSERICPVIANVKPVSCGFKRNGCSLFRISRAKSRTE